MSDPFYEVASIDYPIIDSDAHVNEPPGALAGARPGAPAGRARRRSCTRSRRRRLVVRRRQEAPPARPHRHRGAELPAVPLLRDALRRDPTRAASTRRRVCATSTPTGCTRRSSIPASRWRARARTPTIASCSAPACAPTTSGCWSSARRPAAGSCRRRSFPTTGVDDAVAELEWAIKHGHRGALIATFPGGSYEPTAEDDPVLGDRRGGGVPARHPHRQLQRVGPAAHGHAEHPRLPRRTPAGRRRAPTRSRPPPRCCSRARASASRACAS